MEIKQGKTQRSTFSNHTVLLSLNKYITHIIYICSPCSSIYLYSCTSLTKCKEYTHIPDDLIKSSNSYITIITSKYANRHQSGLADIGWHILQTHNILYLSTL